MIDKILSNFSGTLREGVKVFLVVVSVAAVIFLFKSGVKFGHFLWERFN